MEHLIRLQPFIPNYSLKDPEEFVEKVSEFGIQQITVEMIRIEREELEYYRSFWEKWNPYSFEGNLIKAEAPEILRELSLACRKYGLDFGLCKEGYFDLETANCCRM